MPAHFVHEHQGGHLRLFRELQHNLNCLPKAAYRMDQFVLRKHIEETCFLPDQDSKCPRGCDELCKGHQLHQWQRDPATRDLIQQMIVMFVHSMRPEGLNYLRQSLRCVVAADKLKHVDVYYPLYLLTLQHVALAMGNLNKPRILASSLLKLLMPMIQEFGLMSMEVAHLLHNLGNTYGEVDQPQLRLRLLKGALAIKRSIVGEEDPDYANTLQNIAVTKGALDQPQDAFVDFRCAALVMAKKLGSESESTLIVLFNLAQIYGILRLPDQMILLLERILPVMSKVFGCDHAHVQKALTTLIRNCDSKEKIDAYYRLLQHPEHVERIPKLDLTLGKKEAMKQENTSRDQNDEKKDTALNQDDPDGLQDTKHDEFEGDEDDVANGADKIFPVPEQLVLASAYTPRQILEPLPIFQLKF